MRLPDLPTLLERRPRAVSVGLAVAIILGATFLSIVPRVQAIGRIRAEATAPAGQAPGPGDPRKAELEARLGSLKTRIPPGAGMMEVTDRITQFCQRSRVQVSDISTKTPERSGRLVRIPVQISLKGRAGDVCEVLGELKRLERLVGLEHLEASVGTDGMMAVDATLTAYAEGD
jgi:hypothetical protein